MKAIQILQNTTGVLQHIPRTEWIHEKLLKKIKGKNTWTQTFSKVPSSLIVLLCLYLLECAHLAQLTPKLKFSYYSEAGKKNTFSLCTAYPKLFENPLSFPNLELIWPINFDLGAKVRCCLFFFLPRKPLDYASLLSSYRYCQMQRHRLTCSCLDSSKQIEVPHSLRKEIPDNVMGK